MTVTVVLGGGWRKREWKQEEGNNIDLQSTPVCAAWSKNYNIYEENSHTLTSKRHLFELLGKN
jgi:hypothetical protein